MSQFGPSRAGDLLARTVRRTSWCLLFLMGGAGLGVSLAKLLRWVLP